MLSPRAFSLLLALPALALVGCDSGDAGLPLSGTYTGSAFFAGDSFDTLSLVIPSTESGSFAFSGTYEIEGGGTFDVTGTGVYDHPSATIDAAFLETGEEFGFTGVVSDFRDEIRVDSEGLTFTLQRG